MQLDFFPSRTLTLYLARLFVVRIVAMLAVLVLVLMMLDLLGQSGKILAVPGNGQAELLTYIGLRVPQLIARFLPYSVLLATIITLIGLNQNSEVIAMKAAGMSAHQLLAPLIVASLGLAVVAFAFNEGVVTSATRQLSAWDDNDYKPVPPDSGILSNVWVTAGDDLVRARIVTGRGQGVRLQNVTLYDRQGITITRVIEAARARPQDNGWLLEDVRIYDSGMNMVRQQPSLATLPGVEPERFTLAKVNPESENFFALRPKIEEMERAGVPTDAVRAGYWHKLSEPLSTILMPLLAGVAAFGLARSGKVLLRATVGMALGFAYFVADNFALAMGNVGAYPPLLAAWAPFFLFLLIGETVLIRSEE